MTILTEVAKALGIWAVIAAFVYVVVYSIAARQEGCRLFSRRRIRAVWTGKAELVRGPFDGCEWPTTRLAALGITLNKWYDVSFDVATRTYHMDPERHRRRGDERQIWAGYYAWHCTADCYRWTDTSLMQYADLHRKAWEEDNGL